MKQFVFFISILTCSIIHAQTNKIIMGTLDSVYSNILHEKRKVWVHMPDTTSPDGIFYKQRYPVVYLLDGDAASVAIAGSLLDQMGGGGGNLSFPQMILVGIPNTNRNRDLTPTHVSSTPALDSFSAAQTGGGENFIAFMEKELIPHIDSAYPTAPYRVLIGHSFGGLTAINILIHHTNLFNAYIASEPSMWWDNQMVLKQAKQALQQQNFSGRCLYLAMANTMDKGLDTVTVKRDTNFNSLHIRSIMQLGHYLNADKQNGLSFNWKYYPDYSHGNVLLFSEYDGLPSLFSFYGYNFPYGEFFKPDYNGDTLLAAHYKELSRQMGYTLSPPEQMVCVLAHALTDQKQYSRALYFLNLNINSYPKSFNAYAQMGDFYVATGDKQKAAVYYNQALALRNEPSIKTKLDKLK